jgi:hypothetical protein
MHHQPQRDMDRATADGYIEKIAHFTQSVYFIGLCESYDPTKRGGGAVLAVNLARRLEGGPTGQAEKWRPGDRRTQVVSPLRNWKSNYEQLFLRGGALSKAVTNVS